MGEQPKAAEETLQATSTTDKPEEELKPNTSTTRKQQTTPDETGLHEPTARSEDQAEQEMRGGSQNYLEEETKAENKPPKRTVTVEDVEDESEQPKV